AAISIWSMRSSPDSVRVALSKEAFIWTFCRSRTFFGAARTVGSSIVWASRSRVVTMSFSSLVMLGVSLLTWFPSLLDAEVTADAGHMARRLDVVLGVGDHAVRADDDRRADDSLDDLAVQLLLTISAPGRHHRLVRVGEQCDRQPIPLAELRELLGLVRRDADDLGVRGAERLEGVAEVTGLLRAARRHRGRVEVDDDPLAAEVAQRHLRAGVVREGEVRGLVARCESLAHGCLAHCLCIGAKGTSPNLSQPSRRLSRPHRRGSARARPRCAGSAR